MPRLPTVSVRATGASGWVLRQAKKLAQSLVPGGGATRLLDGYLVKANRFGNHATAKIIDSPVALLGLSGNYDRQANRHAGCFATTVPRSGYALQTTPDSDEPWPTEYRAPAYLVNTYGEIGGPAYRFWQEPANVLGRFLVRGSATPITTFPSGQSPFWSDSLEAAVMVTVHYPPALSLRLTQAWLEEAVPGATMLVSYQGEAPRAVEPPVSPVYWSDLPYLPRWNIIAPTQYPTPATGLVSSQLGVGFASLFQVAYLPGHQMVLSSTVNDVTEPTWFMGTAYIKRAATPSLVVASSVLRPTTPADFAGVDALSLIRSPIDDQPVAVSPTPSTQPTRVLSLLGAVEVPIAQWPEWFRPVPFVPSVYPLAGPEDVVGLDESGIPAHRPCVVGRGAATSIDGVVEYLMAVKTTDHYWQPVTSAHRSEDPITPGEVAGVIVTRTGLMAVRYSAEGVLSVTEVARDVLAPATCPLYDDTMDAGSAFLPHVLWGGVLGGKRCYAVRAVRYVRNLWLGSFVQGVSSFVPFTTGYRGIGANTPTGSDRFTPWYSTDLGWGPYVDVDRPEELWWFVDGQKTVLPMPPNSQASPQTFFDYGFAPAAGDAWTSWFAADRLSHMGIPPEDYGTGLIASYALEEYCAPPGATQQFAWIAEGKIMFALWPRRYTRTVRLYTFDGGSLVMVTEVDMPGYSSSSPDALADQPHENYALTCYQRETPSRDGSGVRPAGLILTLAGRYGYALVSSDGGATWTKRVDAPTSWSNAPRPGVPAMGYHFAGTPLWRPELGYPIHKRISENN